MSAGSDYSQSSVDLARAVAERRGMDSVQWCVDDILHTGLTDRCAIHLHALSFIEILCLPDS